jgi:hypothetical protein
MAGGLAPVFSQWQALALITAILVVHYIVTHRRSGGR